MRTLGKWRWPVLVMVPCGVVAGLAVCGVVRLDYTTQVRLANKGKVHIVAGNGTTPSLAVRTAEAVAASVIQASLDRKKAGVRVKISAIQKRQAAVSSALDTLNRQQQATRKGSKAPWTPEMASKLNAAKARRWALREYPTHTDIPVLDQQIKSLEAQQRGSAVKVDRAQVAALGKKINELRNESSFLAHRQKGLEAAAKQLQPDWKITQPAAQPRWPSGVPGWPIAAGAAAPVFLMGVVLTRGKKKKATFSAEPISLELAAETPEALPDNPLTRKAASLYDRWLTLVKAIYAPGAKPPQNVFADAAPLFKETAAFLSEGQDILTRHLARVVLPGDLPAHVARTVLMALMGAYEAGASSEQQEGMTYAALFHDLAVAPRPAHAWTEIGSEVGRLSSGVLSKIPNLPAPLRARIEEILVGMDEYALDTWHNVPRNPTAEPFAKLLRHIDRFDKVLQKQKTRLTRRLSPAA